LKNNKSGLGVHRTGVLCDIIDSKLLKNGNYDIIVSGLEKVIINTTQEHRDNYEVASLDIIFEDTLIQEEKLKRKKLINKFMDLLSSGEEKIDLNMIDPSMISTELLTNLASLILPIENKDKQKLLELNKIELRLEVLCQFLDSELKVESDLLNFNQIIPRNIKWN